MKEENPTEKTIRSNRNKLILSGFLFAVGYVAIVALVFLAIYLQTGSADIKAFLFGHTDDEFSFLVSLFVLHAIVYLYFFFEDREFLQRAGNVVLLYTLMILSAILCYVWGKLIDDYFYTRPYALFALLALFLIGRRHALFLNVIFALLVFSVDVFARDYSAAIDVRIYSTQLIGFAEGTLAIFLADKVRTRIKLVLTGLILALPTIVFSFAFQVPNSTYGWIDYLSSAGFQIIGCMTSAVLALSLMPVFEVVFGRLTVFRLRELTSTRVPILDRLRKEAPGTFTHSLVVAQLCESCALAIGEDAELARAAAYYHDVGKLKQPDCFTENQTGYNIHDELTPELSADIIRSHTNDGYDLLIGAHLPREIADVAREHHGTMPIKYFYDKANKLSAGDADIRDFSYLGPTPRSRIAAITMIADSAEAAVRAITDRSPENVEKVVRGIIEERMDLDQFACCDITQKELSTIKQTLVDTLSNVHHHRVHYPAIRFTRERKAVSEK